MTDVHRHTTMSIERVTTDLKRLAETGNRQLSLVTKTGDTVGHICTSMSYHVSMYV